MRDEHKERQGETKDKAKADRQGDTGDKGKTENTGMHIFMPVIIYPIPHSCHPD